MATLQKKQRSVVGITNMHQRNPNRTASISPRRPVAHHLPAIDLLAATSLSKVSQVSPSPRTAPLCGDSPRFSMVDALMSSSESRNRDDEAKSIRVSPRDAGSARQQNEELRDLADVARINGMRALLFDQFDAATAARPPIPAAPVAQTRFSARSDKDSRPLVQAAPGTSYFASPTERFAVTHSFGGTIGKEDCERSKLVVLSRAAAARSLCNEQTRLVQQHDVGAVKHDQGRIAAKAELQKNYAALASSKSK